MSYYAQTDTGNDNTWRPKLASGKNDKFLLHDRLFTNDIKKQEI